jgi:hypothetical protein
MWLFGAFNLNRKGVPAGKPVKYGPGDGRQKFTSSNPCAERKVYQSLSVTPAQNFMFLKVTQRGLYLRHMPLEKQRAERNRTIELSEAERSIYSAGLLRPSSQVTSDAVLDQVIHADIFSTLDHLPDTFVDLLFVDPPYNMDKVFGEERFKEMNDAQYADWLDAWVNKCVRLLKPNASVYICGDWKSSSAIQRVAEKYFVVRNRITWEREKGRGALSNWKNSSEDIWFCTVGKDYHFDAEAVKLKRKVVAPYTDESGAPKDWERSDQGSFRLTHRAICGRTSPCRSGACPRTRTTRRRNRRSS